MRLTKTLHSRRETEGIARELGNAIRSRATGGRALVIALAGELGAGKTAFVKGLARALGVRRPIVSPTFVLLRKYPLPRSLPYRFLCHMDWYRVRDARELSALMLGELFRVPENIVAIEWPERAPERVPRGAVRVFLRHGARENERTITLRAAGLNPRRAAGGRPAAPSRSKLPIKKKARGKKA